MSIDPANWSKLFAGIGNGRRNIGDPTGKAGQIVAEMEQRLMLGYYRSGEMLSFATLAESFDVSRQPVSAAIAHLRASGYVEVLPHVGCRVVQPSPHEIRDFFAVLGKIDSAVAVMAAQRHEASEAESLLDIRPPDKGAPLDQLGNRKAYLDYIDRFHDQIWRMARAPLLEGKFSGLRRLSSFYLWQGVPAMAPRAAEILTAERTEIANAIAARDCHLAATLMEAHISRKPNTIGIGL